MKTYLSALLIAAGFFVTSTSSAQMPMGQMNPYGRPGMTNAGMDRGIGVSQYSNGKKQKDKSKNNDNADLLEASLNHLEKELTLDTFQKAVIKDMLENNQTEEKKVFAEDIPDDSKLEKILILRRQLDQKIRPILSKEQVDLLAKMKDKQDKYRS